MNKYIFGQVTHTLLAIEHLLKKVLVAAEILHCLGYQYFKILPKRPSLKFLLTINSIAS